MKQYVNREESAHVNISCYTDEVRIVVRHDNTKYLASYIHSAKNKSTAGSRAEMMRQGFAEEESSVVESFVLVLGEESIAA